MTRSRNFILIAGVALLGATLYLSYELGRYRAGFSMLDQRRQLDGLGAEIEARDRRIEELDRQIAQLETSSDIDAETYTTIAANLAELEALIQSQEEELGFYRGIVAPGDGVTGLRIQSVEVAASEDGAAHTLSVVLVQAIVHSERVTGSMRALLRGSEGGEPAEYGLDTLGSGSGSTDIPYGFRYFQTLEAGISLPEAFAPDEIEIQVWPRSPRGETIVEVFDWATVAR